jgi:hypothetical protein
MSTWMDFPNGRVIDINGIEPGKQTVSVPFVFTIPDSIMPGDYRGTLIVHNIKKDSQIMEGGGAGVSFSTAVGLPLTFSVYGERVTDLKLWEVTYSGNVPDEELGEDNETLKIDFRYENLGNSALKVFAEVHVKKAYGDNKEYVRSFDLGNIFPGNYKTAPVVLNGLGKYSGWVDISAIVTYSLVDLSGNVGNEVYDSGNVNLRVYAIPWFEILIVFGIILFIVLLLLFRWYRVRSLCAVSKIYVVKDGDTLQSICSKFGVDGPCVIVANNLKKPYFVTKGSKIFIPDLKKKI